MSTPTQADLVGFDVELVPGNVKSAMAAVGAKSGDLWQVALDDLRVLENFNPRIRNESYHADVRAFADSMKEEGFYRHKPLAGYVAMENGQSVIYITDGHTRREAALLARSEGAELGLIPVVVNAKGTAMEDLNVALVRSNTGRPLTPYEIGIVCKRLMKFNMDEETIGRRIGVSPRYVSSLLTLMAAPHGIRKMVEDELVSASTAMDAIRDFGNRALEQLQAGLEKAKDAGRTRVTGKHLSQPTFRKEVRKAAPQLFVTMREIKSDPGFLHLSTETREKLENMLAKLDELEAAEKSAVEPKADPDAASDSPETEAADAV